MRVTPIEVSYRLTESHDWSNVQVARRCDTCYYWLRKGGPGCPRYNIDLEPQGFCSQWRKAEVADA